MITVSDEVLMIGMFFAFLAFLVWRATR